MAMFNGKLLNYKKVFPQSTIELVINTINHGYSMAMLVITISGTLETTLGPWHLWLKAGPGPSALRRCSSGAMMEGVSQARAQKKYLGHCSKQHYDALLIINHY